MGLALGTKLGPYEIVSAIGAGGMGEVYRARDTRLGRDVAVKILPANFSANPDRLRRFEQEACAAGALNHPNILAIHDVGTHEGSPYVVSELLEGETLRERLGSDLGPDLGPQASSLPQRKVIDYALQIARGLGAAHEKGIVHRDLKPENLFITKDGRVKILDFGLAKLTEPAEGVFQQSDLPTRRVDTDPGIVIGTVGYMSPEQVRGRPADHRSDIFAFGAILYEMLSGRRAFHGESAADTMSAILKEDPPDLTQTSQGIAPALERVVRHCLEKNPEERFHSASDLAFAIEALSGSTATSAQTAAIPTVAPRWIKSRELIAWSVAAALLLSTVALSVLYSRRTPEEVHAVRFFIHPPEKSSFNFVGLNRGPITISPDGRHLAFVAPTAEGKNLLWVRPLDALSAQALTGTEGATYPFWSADSRFIGFFAERKLKKIEASGGPPLTLCDAPVGRGGTWNRDGVIVFAPGLSGTLQRVSASGGVASAVTKLDEAQREGTHRWPCFLPDGRHFLYLGGARLPSEGSKDIYVASLDSQGRKLLLHANSNAAYAQGYVLFLREGTLMAQGFDAKRLETVGDAFPIAEQVQYELLLAIGIFSVSESGVLAYQTGAPDSGSQLTWFDRNGKSLGMLGDQALYATVHLSPDGKRATTSIGVQGGRPDIWLYDVPRGLRQRFTFDPAAEREAIWSPDGGRIVFNSDRKDRFDLYQKASSLSGSEELLLESNLDKIPTSFSPDGRFLLYYAIDPKTLSDLWVLPASADRESKIRPGEPFPFLQTEFSEVGGQFSPDGRWIAYASDESRRREVYVAPFPGPGGKRQISTGGGSQPKWRGDGKEIFYLAPDNKLMAAEVNGKGATLEVGAVRPLFEIGPPAGPGSVYDVTADGQRFLVNTSVGQRASSPITVVLNWTADLKR